MIKIKKFYFFKILISIILFIILLVIFFNIVSFSIYSNDNINLKEPTDEQITEEKEKYEYGYQKNYSKNYYPFRLNNYEDIRYGIISYNKAINSLSGYNYPNIMWNKKFLDKILFDNELYNFRNSILVKDDILYAEIEDIARIIDCNIKLKLYNRDEEECKIGVMFQKYDKSLEINVTKYKNTEYSNKYPNIKIMPGAIINDFDENDSGNYPIIKDYLIYIPLSYTLEYFDYDIEYDKTVNILKVINNSSRVDLTWQEIYENTIYNAVNSGKVDSIALLDVTGDGIPEIFFKSEYDNAFETGTTHRITRGDPRFYCFWYNCKEKKLEVKADTIYNYLCTENGIILHRAIFAGAMSYDEKCIWNESMSDFIYEDWDMSWDGVTIPEPVFPNFVEFKTYESKDILNNNINIIDIVNSAINPDLTLNQIDISENKYDEWAKESIETAISLGLVPNDLQKYYKEKITREEFCNIAIQLFLQKQEKTFDEYTKENNIELNKNIFIDTENLNVILAYYLGIVNGTGDNKFSPDNYITRQEAAVLLDNLYNVMDSNEETTSIEKYSDDVNISDWAKESVYKMSGLSVLYGVGDNIFNPLGNYTRQEAIVTACRIYTML